MTPEEIKQRLLIELEMSGVADVNKAMRLIIKNTSLLSSNTSDLNKKYGSLANVIPALAKQYASMNRNAVRGGKLHSQVIQDLTSKYGLLGRAVGKVGRTIKPLLLPASFAGAVKITMAYEKSLLAAAARVNRLGIGLRQLETGLMGVASATGFTRQETIELFKEFERGIKLVSFEGFESSLQRITKLVGANTSAAKRYLTTLTSTSQKYPILVKNIMQGGKALDDYSEAQTRALYLSGKLGDEEYRNIIAIIRGNKQLTQEGSRDYQQYQNHIRAMQDFRRQVERVALLFGETILPILEKIANWMKVNLVSTEDWVKALGVAAIAVGSVKAGLGVAQGLAGGWMLKRSIGLGAGAIAGSMGGTAAAGTALGGTALGGTALGGMFAYNAIARGGSAAATIPVSATVPVAAAAVPASAGLLSKGTMLKGGLAAAAAYFGGGYLESKWVEEEKYRAAGGAGIGKSLGAIGGGALAGSIVGGAIGSVVPVIGNVVGAGVGAAIGGIAGLITQIDDLKVSIHRLRTGEDLKESLEVPPELARQLEVITRRQKQFEVANKEAKESMKELFNLENYQKLKKGVEIAEQAVKEARKTFDAEMKIEYGEVGEQWLSSGEFDKEVVKRRKEIGNMREAIERMGKSGADGDQIKTAIVIRKQKEAELSKMVGIREEAESNNDALDKSKTLLAINSAKLEAQVELARTNVIYAEALNALYREQSGALSSLIEKMGLIGNVNFEELLKEHKEMLKTIDTQREVEKGISIVRKQALEDAMKARLAAEKVGDPEEMTRARTAETDAAAELEKTIKNIRNLDSQRVKVTLQIADAMKGQIQHTSLQAQQMQKMVSLADNFAIGVGASVKLRMMQYRAETKIIEKLQEQFSITNQAYRQFLQQGKQEKAIAAENKLLEISNQILDSQVKRAQAVKALRDGWISAISAMNTGAGVFTKILFKQ
ncbi:hypothetical protein LCGC14_1384800, partial [marine sediment metagenome]